MPKIKNPISQAERDYNKRYTKDIQKHYVSKLYYAKLNKKFFPDKYQLDFLHSVTVQDMNGIPHLRDNIALTENQADFLASLYDKYTD